MVTAGFRCAPDKPAVAYTASATPIPHIMLISHKPKLAPATFSAATQPTPKKINKAVPKNSPIQFAFNDLSIDHSLEVRLK